MPERISAKTPIDVFLSTIDNIQNNLGAVVRTYKKNLQAKWNFQQIDLQLFGGLLPTHIKEIRLYANGNVIQKYRSSVDGLVSGGTILDTINKYRKLPAYNAIAGASILSLYMTRVGIRGGIQGFDKGSQTLISGSAKDLETECSLNCGSYAMDGNGKPTLGISSLRIEIDVTGTPAAGALAIDLNAKAYDPYPGGPGLIMYVDATSFNASLGRNTVTKDEAFVMGDMKRALLEQVYMVPDAGVGPLDNFTMYMNNEIIMLNRTNARNQFLQTAQNLRTPQAGMDVLDWSSEGWGDQDMLISPSDTDTTLEVDTAAAGGILFTQFSMGYVFPVAKV